MYRDDIDAERASASGRLDPMSSNCDRVHCGRPATHRLTGRPYCARHAAEIAGAANVRAGRAIVRLVPIVVGPARAPAYG